MDYEEIQHADFLGFIETIISTLSCVNHHMARILLNKYIKATFSFPIYGNNCSKAAKIKAPTSDLKCSPSCIIAKYT